MNLGWYLESATWDHPMKVAAINGHTHEKITYLELNTLSNKIGNALREKYELKEDDVLTTLMTEDWLHMAIMYGIMKIGCVFCGLNRTHLIDKLVYDVTTTKSKLLILSSDFLALGKQLAERIKGLNLLVSDSGTEYPNLPDLLKDASGELRIAPRANLDLAAINFTAGTTGASKGVMFCHGILGTSVQGSIFWGGISAKDVIVAPIGLFHSGGISDSIRSVMAKATVIWMAGWTSDKAADIIMRYKPSWFHFIVPTMIRDLQNNPNFDKLDLNGMKANVAGAPVPADMQEMLNKRGMRTINFYGMTETMPCIVTLSSMYYGDWKNPVLGSSGKDYKEFGIAKIIDTATGKEITKPGERGEIWFKGDVLTPGYYADPERTKEAIDADGWFHTSDLAYKDENGYYFVGGRVDDMILCGGEKLSLVEIDIALLKCPLVKDAGAIGVPHERFGEVPAAFIVPNQDMTEEEIKDKVDKYCRETLERWKRPRLYIKVDKIPRTLAKGTKAIQDLRKLTAGIHLSDKDGNVTTFGKLKK